MSGGVDSAVALLAAGGRGRRHAPALDRPERAASERACCSPAAVIAARETCHRLGMPHVTLDLRERVPRARSSSRSSRGYARGETPNPCVRCNGSFRFDELLALRRARSARAARDRPLRAHRRARRRRCVARAADAAKDQSYMLATLDPQRLGRLWFPLGEQTKEETRAAGRGRRPRRRARAESQEACFLGGDDYRAFLGAHGPRGGARAPIVDEDGRRARHARRLLALHAGPAAGPRRRRARAALRALDRREHEHRRRRPARVARARRRVEVRGRLDRRRGPGRGEAPPPLAGGRGDGRRARRGGFELAPRRALLRRRPGPDGGALRRRRSSAAGVIVAATAD